MINTKKRPIIDADHNSDGSKTIYYFGKVVGHIYPMNIENKQRMKFRAISNYDDVRHFENEHSATSFLLASV